MGIWGVTDFPLKYEVREQYDDRNALLINDLENTGGEPEQSCQNDNQQQYMLMSTLRQAYPMLRTRVTQAWLPTYTPRIHDKKWPKEYGHQQYNVDPYFKWKEKS